jgi:hypothetical protein
MFWFFFALGFTGFLFCQKNTLLCNLYVSFKYFLLRLRYILTFNLWNI